jgi:hypothetical protein
MNVVDIWLMERLFVPNVVGGSTRNLRISYANRQALEKLEKERMISIYRIQESDKIPSEEWIYEVKLTEQGISFMSNHAKLPNLSVGVKLQYSGDTFTYAYKEKRPNGEIIVWMRNRQRELHGVPARMVSFAQ